MGRGGAPDSWDEMFAYQTVKMVVIKNKKLGLLHYFFMLLIALYLAIYVFMMQKKYLTLDSPIANSRFSTMGPCQPLKGQDDLLCTQAPPSGAPSVGENCTGAYMCNKLPYCIAPDDTNYAPAYARLKTTTVKNGQMPCIYADHNTITWPPSEQNAVTLATRISQYRQQLRKGGIDGPLCAPAKDAKGIATLPQQDWDCQYEPTVSSGNSIDAYIADVGNWSLKMAHTVMGQVLPISVSGLRMSGNLQRCLPGKDCGNYANFESVKEFNPSIENGGDATMTVGEILDAVVPDSHVGHKLGHAGLDLDHTSRACPGKCLDAATGKHKLDSIRYKGIVIMVEVQYDNTGLIIKESSQDNIKFNIRFWASHESTFGVEVPYAQAGNQRLINHMYGIRLVTMTKGHFGMPTMHAVIIQLTTSIAMLLLSTTIMDILLTKFMLNRDYYKFVKYEQEEEQLNALESYIAQAQHLTEEEKQQRLQYAIQLREESGVDWKAAISGGLCSNVDENRNEKLFDQDVKDVVKKLPVPDPPQDEEAGEEKPLVPKRTQPESDGSGACCVVS